MGHHTCTPNEIHSGSHIVWGTSEQLGMRPRCDLTICTAPNIYGGFHRLGYFRPWVPETSGLWVSKVVMGVRNTPWG